MNAADIARKMELAAVASSHKAADHTSHPAGKRMFLSIMEDEQRHVWMINSLIKSSGMKEEELDPMERVKTVFEQHEEDFSNKMPATSEDKEALQTAMNMEKEGMEFYKKLAARGWIGLHWPVEYGGQGRDWVDLTIFHEELVAINCN